jgi:hypothetical protein
VSTARTVSAPEAIALSPDGKNAYVTSEHLAALSQFAISPVTGKITPLSPAIVTAPSHGSLGVAVTPDAGLAAQVTAPATAWHGSAPTYTITIADQGGPASALAPSNQSVYRQYHAYSLCLRTHGAPFWPEPTAVSHGVFDSPYAYVITKRVLAEEHGSGWRTALRHCAALAIRGSPYTAAQLSKLRSQLDKLAACMRRHGVAKFPSPVLTPAGGGFPSPGTAVDSGSAQFAAAQQACWARAPGSAGAEPSPAGIVVRGYFGAVNSASARHGKLDRQARRYTKCMRTHGVADFPAAKPGKDGSVVYPVNPPAGMLSSAGYDPAVRACLNTAIHGRSPRYRTLVLGALKQAECMRSRGISGFPSPATLSGGIHVPDITTPFVATHTAQFLASAKACKMTGLWNLTWWWRAGSVRL